MNGVEKYVDELGRVVLPIKMRNKLNIRSHSIVIISMEDDTILITPKERCCALCGCGGIENDSVRLCNNCIAKIKKL